MSEVKDITSMGRQELIDALREMLRESNEERKELKEVRAELEEAHKTIFALCEEARELRAERDSYLVNLTSTQARCTELLQDLRKVKEAARDALARTGLL